jgi:hypothetical protein
MKPESESGASTDKPREKLAIGNERLAEYQL